MNRYDFVDIMMNFQRGISFCCNAIDGYTNGLLLKNILADYLEKCAAEYDSYISRRGTPTNDVVWAMMAYVSRNIPTHSVRGYWLSNWRFGSGVGDSEEIGTVFNVGKFLKDISLSTWWKRWGQGETDLADSKVPIGFQFQDYTVDLKPGVKIGRTDSLLWFTKLNLLATLFSPTPTTNITDRLRDFLGLCHYNKDQGLAIYIYNGSWLNGVINARPTCIDSLPHTRFKAIQDTLIYRADVHWGHTVDLEKLSSGLPNIDGGPERISLPLVPKNDQIRIRFLGNLQYDSSNVSNSVFTSRLRGARSNPVISSELKRII